MGELDAPQGTKRPAEHLPDDIEDHHSNSINARLWLAAEEYQQQTSQPPSTLAPSSVPQGELGALAPMTPLTHPSPETFLDAVSTQVPEEDIL